MIDCRQTAERLTAYVDDTLAPDERFEVSRHLDLCVSCRTAAFEEQGARTVLRECAPRLRSTTVPPAVRAKCAALARQGQRAGTTAPWRARFVPAFLVAILLVFTTSAIVSLATRRSDALLAAQLTADHVKCFKIFAPANTAGADSRQVEAMLADRYGWDVHVPPSSAAEGVKLIGARRCLYGDGTIPHVMYQVNGKDVSLYMLEGVTRSASDLVTLGHRSRIWSHGATTYVLVSPAEAGDLSEAARYVMEEAH